MQICERRHFTKANGDILFHLANKSKKTNKKKKKKTPENKETQNYPG